VEAHGASDGQRIVLRDRAGRSWPLAHVAGAVRGVHWLDGDAVPAGERAALARAFYDAALYDGQLRAVAFHPRAVRRQP
jgi:hypothetical protein